MSEYNTYIFRNMQHHDWNRLICTTCDLCICVIGKLRRNVLAAVESLQSLSSPPSPSSQETSPSERCDRSGVVVLQFRLF